MASAALCKLAQVSSRDLTRPGASGNRILHELLIQCRAAGLTAASLSDDDVANLHSIFDVALQYGLALAVYDYVVEVCSDKYCTSR